MKEIREIFETVSTYCGMIFGEKRAAKQLGSGATHVALSNNIGSDFKHWCKVLAAKSVMENTESILAPMAGERICGRTECNESGKRADGANCDRVTIAELCERKANPRQESSSLRTVVSIRNAGAGENQNEIIQSYPSPEFLNSLPFIKKFYPTPRWGEGKVTEVALDNNLNSSEIDHASMSLGIFASKSVSHKANVGGVGTPPYVAKSVSLSDWQIRPTAKNLAAWLPSCLAAKKAAFTLAEVLITLGIIGVVAALTLPTLIQNHQKQVYVTQLKKAYSNINNAFNKMAVDEGVVDWNQTYCSSQSLGYSDDEVTIANNNECLDRIAKQMKVINTKYFGVECSTDWCKDGDSSSIYYIYDAAAGMFTTPDGALYLFSCNGYSVLVDINGAAKGPNKDGRDVFGFSIDSTHNKIEPFGTYNDYWKDCSATNLSTNCTAKVLIEGKMNY